MTFFNPKMIAIFSIGLMTSFLSYGQGPKRSFEKSAFSSYKSLPSNKDAIEKSTNLVHDQFSGWVVTTDKLNGYFTDIYGQPINIDGNTNIVKSQNCMDQKLSDLGVNKAEWKMVSAPSARKADYVNYRQSINGRSVVFSWLSFRFTKQGGLARIKMKNYGAPGKNTKPVLSGKEAINAAIKDLGDVVITKTETDKDWSWFPVPSAKGYELHPAWHFTITGKIPGGIPLSLTGYTDAITGELLYRTNEVKETGYDLTVKGVVYKNGTLNPATSEPLQNLKLDIATGAYFTDTAGTFSSSLLVLPQSTVIPLAGKWSTVIDSPTGLTPVFTDLVSLSGTTYTYPTTPIPSSDRHINAYYHVNRVHDFMKGWFGTLFTGMDTSLTTLVDLYGGTCNAFYNHSTINFFAAGAGCHSFAEIGDVIYHEYGHGISDHFYTQYAGSTIMNGALNEACSDIWALGITHSPVLAANAFVGYGGFIRRYDLMPQVYPIDLQGFDTHKDGQIIAGCWWDLGVNIGSFDTMAKLFTDVYFDVPDGASGYEGAIYQSILIDALMADDNDANLFNGTPHYAQIVAAFAKHGIYLHGDAFLNHTELHNQLENNPIPVHASLSLTTATYVHDLTLYYRLNGAGAWNPIVLTNSSLSFTGNIPAQPLGTTVEYYFVVHDSLNTPTAFFPITCNPALPVNQRSIPFQFGVGVVGMDSTNFESAVAGWSISSNPGDDATTGLWQRMVPIPSSTIFTSWPYGDHTTGSGKCLVTGTGTGGGGFSGMPVQNGTTSVITPVFDVSGYTKPVIQYYRWFSNEQAFSNFKKDPWIVKIRDASNATWITVENTYQADVNWRKRIFPVSQYLPTATHIQLKFFASDSVYTNWENNGQTITVGGVDDFIIYDQGDRTGVQNISAVKVEIFPNPADEQIHIVLQEGNSGTIKLFDMTGKQITGIVLEQNKSEYTISTRTLAEGNYNLVIEAGKSIQSKKVVVLHQ